MRRLYSVFYIVKLTTIFEDLILGQHTLSLLKPVDINREEKWKVKRVLDSY